MQIIQITELGSKDATQIYQLAHDMGWSTFTPIQYVDYLKNYWDQVGLFVIKDGDNILGFIQAEEPYPLETSVSWIAAAVIKPGVPKELSSALLEASEAWIKSKGATQWFAKTKRSVRALSRRWNLKLKGVVNGDYIIGKTI